MINEADEVLRNARIDAMQNLESTDKVKVDKVNGKFIIAENKIMKIYAVVGSNFDCDYYLKCFTTEEDAENFKSQCEEYHKGKPVMPEKDYDNESLWDTYHDELDKWAKDHPAGEESYYIDKFYITKLDLIFS